MAITAPRHIQPAAYRNVSAHQAATAQVHQIDQALEPQRQRVRGPLLGLADASGARPVAEPLARMGFRGMRHALQTENRRLAAAMPVHSATVWPAGTAAVLMSPHDRDLAGHQTIGVMRAIDVGEADYHRARHFAETSEVQAFDAAQARRVQQIQVLQREHDNLSSVVGKFIRYATVLPPYNKRKQVDPTQPMPELKPFRFSHLLRAVIAVPLYVVPAVVMAGAVASFAGLTSAQAAVATATWGRWALTGGLLLANATFQAFRQHQKRERTGDAVAHAKQEHQRLAHTRGYEIGRGVDRWHANYMQQGAEQVVRQFHATDQRGMTVVAEAGKSLTQTALDTINRPLHAAQAHERAAFAAAYLQGPNEQWRDAVQGAVSATDGSGRRKPADLAVMNELMVYLSDPAQRRRALAELATGHELMLRTGERVSIDKAPAAREVREFVWDTARNHAFRELTQIDPTGAANPFGTGPATPPVARTPVAAGP